MVHVLVYSGTSTRSFYFYELLDGLIYIRDNVAFDHIVVDEETTVHAHEFVRYLRTINDYCRRVCGYYYDI